MNDDNSPRRNKIKNRPKCSSGRFFFLRMSHETLSGHGFGNFLETGNVRAHDEIVGVAEFDGVLFRVAVNVRHDAFQAFVDFLKRPAETFGVLAHLKRTDRDAARVGSFGGTEKNFVRVSKSFLVNIAHIEYIRPMLNSKLKLIMTNKDVVEVNRTYVKSFKERMDI